jgi:hypothetical protein
MDLSKFALIALISEAIWETSKMVWQQGKINIDRIGAILVGILVALLTGLDLFKAIGFQIAVPFVGQLLTGLLISRGANFMHDILGSMSMVYSNKKNHI